MKLYDIPNYPDYRVTNYGRVWSVRYQRFLKPYISSTGRERVHLHLGLKNYGSSEVSRLVAYALIPNPLKKTDVNHKDFNPLNNHVDNLEWMTRGENIQYDYDNGRREVQREKVKKQVIRTFDASQVREIRRRLVAGEKVCAIARELNVSHHTISKINQRTTYREEIYQPYTNKVARGEKDG